MLLEYYRCSPGRFVFRAEPSNNTDDVMAFEEQMLTRAIAKVVDPRGDAIRENFGVEVVEPPPFLRITMAKAQSSAGEGLGPGGQPRPEAQRNSPTRQPGAARATPCHGPRQGRGHPVRAPQLTGGCWSTRVPSFSPRLPESWAPQAPPPTRPTSPCNVTPRLPTPSGETLRLPQLSDAQP